MRLIMKDGQSHQVFGKTVNGGDEFEVPDNEGVTWIKMGRARMAKGRVVTEAMQPVTQVEMKPVRSKRYNRSDMRAEDE